MRDPLAPIPSPSSESGFWTQARQPHQTRMEPVRFTEPDSESWFNPLRLLDCENVYGLDRRMAARTQIDQQDPHNQQNRGYLADNSQLYAVNHNSFDHIFALRSCQGWALVRSLSCAPTGLLVRFFNLFEPGLSAAQRHQGLVLLRTIAPHLTQKENGQGGSMLATVGTWILAQRVIADLSEWASCKSRNKSSSTCVDQSLLISLLCPPRSATAFVEQQTLAIQGELVPLTDPNPHVLAISLSPTALRQLTHWMEPA